MTPNSKTYDAYLIPDVDALSPKHLALFELASRESFYHSLIWYKVSMETTLEPGDRGAFLAIDGQDGEPVAIVPLRMSNGRFGLKKVESFTSVYSSIFAPIMAPDADTDTIAHHLVAFCQRTLKCDLLQFDLLDSASAFYGSLVKALESAGFRTEPFFKTGNWFENVEGISFDDYMAKRKSKIRYNIRRRKKKLEEDYSDAHITIYQAPEDIDEGLGHFAAIYQESWKAQEKFPQFVNEICREAAVQGLFRLPIVFADDKPVAGRINFLSKNSAAWFKTTYNPEFRNYSPGMILHTHIVEVLLEQEDLTWLDFGVGDEKHKSDWMSQRRELWGVRATNRSSALGWLLSLMQFLADKLKPLRSRA